MKLPFRRTLILLALLYLGSLLVQSASARSLPGRNQQQPERANSSEYALKKDNATDWAKVRRDLGEPVDEEPEQSLPQYPFASSIKHLVRTNSSNSTNATTEEASPLDFNTSHLPCDLDSGGRESVVWAFPNHCIWAYNNKYNSEKAFKIYKIFQLEAFFFGQYYERLKRFEMDPHVWDYTKTGVT
ncbi:uncharacterized protein LOC117892431 [Drosophila subobscura]|uniref:uncharacterized protein LOC117892431 n=1 Tax=Drosophila subobscura TaxID=7241 RepID=UPI00155A1282|nr:uncharacterized protein LOC117892431 [Drosophila subobscura]